MDFKVFKQSNKLVVTSALLLLVLIVSYINFVDYRPKSIKQVPDVKTLGPEMPSDIPLPISAEKITVSKNSDSTQTTFYSNESKSAIADFYKNIYLSNKWKLESQGVYSDFIMASYSKENGTFKVISHDANEGYKTFVSIESVK